MADNFGLRVDGTEKGTGFFGLQKMTDGSNRDMSEFSIGIGFEGVETQIPTLVPTLTSEELEFLKAGNDPSEDIMNKAVSHARERMEQGRSPFIEDGEPTFNFQPSSPPSGNDLTGSYLSTRGEASTPFDELMASTPVEDEGIDFGAVAKDVGGGIIEAPRQIAGGVMDAINEAALALESIVPLGTVGGDEFTRETASSTDEARTTTGGVIRGISQFVTGFIPALKGAKAAGITNKVGQVMSAGAVADAFAFDPHEDRLSDLIQENPTLSNPITNYLEADEDDSAAEGRFKNAIEGLALGGIADGFFRTIKLLRANRIEKSAQRRLISDKEQAKSLAEVETVEGTPLNRDFIDTLPEHQKDAVEQFSGLGSITTNRELRALGDGDELPRIIREDVFDLDNAIDSHSLTSDVTLFRKVDAKDIPELAENLEGKTFSDKGYLSTTTDESVVDRFSTSLTGDEKTFDKPVYFTIKAGKGEKALPFPGAEKEVLLPRGAQLKVTSDKIIDGRRVIEAEYGTSSKADDFIPFAEKAEKESIEFGGGTGKADDEAAQNINLNRIDSTEDVDKLINMVAEQDAKPINEARREKITLAETSKLADDLGMSVDDLLDRRKGQAFNAEQAVAARKILVASGENLFKIAKKAATGSDEEVALFARAMAQHRAIQTQVSGLTAEAGRALSSFRIDAKTTKAQELAIKEALNAGGGVERMKDIASNISQFDEVGQLNTMLRQGATKPEMVFEAWINGLLSSPTTHVVNALSNAIVAGWSVGERVVASGISKGFGDNAINPNEAVGQLFGIVQGGKEGMKLAWKAIKTGESSDPLQKIEGQQFKRITAENLDLTGVPGRFADYMGEFVRLPGRFLTAGDELFKTMGYRMELNAQAFRTAKNEGLEGDDLARRISSIINDPPENLHIEAIDASRYQTFTRALGERGQSVQNLLQTNPEARVIVPFLRTPTNIMKWVGERTPLAPLNSAIREDIAAGGARRDMALAKISTGSMMMAISADYTMSGNITGGGPKNPQMRNMLRTTGWQPYSIKVGDKYFAYGRLDPVGAFIGLSADITEIMGQVGEADLMDLTMSAVTATAQNVTSKTYLSGVAEFFDMMSSVSADPQSANRQAKRWVERLAGSVVPSGVAQINRTLNPELKATQGILEKIQSRLPGYSDDLPPRRNIFGEPIVLSGGLGPDIMSPIYTSENRKDPIADEIVKQGALIRMPLKNINGVELSTQQYDDYILFYSGKDNQGMKFQPLKDRLAQEMNTGLYLSGSDGPEGLKSQVITRVFAAYRETAKAEMLMKYPEIQNEIDRLKLEKANKLRGL